MEEIKPIVMEENEIENRYQKHQHFLHFLDYQVSNGKNYINQFRLESPLQADSGAQKLIVEKSASAFINSNSGIFHL